MELFLLLLLPLLLALAWRRERKHAVFLAEQLKIANEEFLILTTERDRARSVSRGLIQGKRAVLLSPGIRAGEFI